MLPAVAQDLLSFVLAALWNPMLLRTAGGSLSDQVSDSCRGLEETAAHA